MRQKSCSYGILLLGEMLEIYFINYSTNNHEASLVEKIKYQHNNDAARQLMEVLYRREYNPERMNDYCKKRLKINKSIEYWCSADGKKEIMDMIIERSKLPEHLLETLRSTLIVNVKRIDGLSSVSASKIDVVTKVNDAEITPPNEGERKHKNVWMIPASPKFFNHKGCFDEFGQIYWKQYNKYQIGDIVYIYVSHPEKKIVYKCEVIASELHYNDDMKKAVKYYTNPLDFEEAKKHNRYFLIKRIGETKNKNLSLNNMLQNGLNGAPMGAIKLSDKRFDKLLPYIETNF